jgi:hypothetical protein
VTDKLRAWKGRLMHHNNCLTLIKTTLAAIPVYTTISIKLPPWVINALIKIMKAFLWMGTKEVHPSKCLVAWSYVQWSLPWGSRYPGPPVAWEGSQVVLVVDQPL